MNVEEMGAKRQGPDCIVDEFAEDEDEDDAEDADEPLTDAPRIWKVGGTAAATGPTPPVDALVAATFVVVNMEEEEEDYYYSLFSF